MQNSARVAHSQLWEQLYCLRKEKKDQDRVCKSRPFSIARATRCPPVHCFIVSKMWCMLQIYLQDPWHATVWTRLTRQDGTTRQFQHAISKKICLWPKITKYGCIGWKWNNFYIWLCKTSNLNNKYWILLNQSSLKRLRQCTSVDMVVFVFSSRDFFWQMQTFKCNKDQWCCMSLLRGAFYIFMSLLHNIH